jgi:SET domain-containing protein
MFTCPHLPQFEEEPDAEPLPCNCGAANCAGRMN